MSDGLAESSCWHDKGNWEASCLSSCVLSVIFAETFARRGSNQVQINLIFCGDSTETREIRTAIK